MEYTYDSNGIRTGKLVNGTKTTYFLDGSTIIAQQTDSNVLWFLYDSDRTLVGFTYNDTAYYYTKNVQGDVTGIVDSNVNLVAEYTYDAWGRLLSTTYENGYEEVAQANPFRYRGYYYDSETRLYCLSSRYYDLQTGRFLNADNYISTGQGLSGNNMFAYCGNNFINAQDPSGGFFEFLFEDSATMPWKGVGDGIVTPWGGFSIPVAPSFPTTPFIGPLPLYWGTTSSLPYTEDLSSTSKIDDTEAILSLKSNQINKYEQKPIARRNRYSSRKDAYEAAKKAGSGKKPRLDGPENGRLPHFHPNVEQIIRITRDTVTKHDHYYFPKSKFSWTVTVPIPIYKWC